MKITNLGLNFVCLAVFAFMLVPVCAQAAEKKTKQELEQEKEAKDAAAEDEAEKAMPENQQMKAIKNVDGRLVLVPPEDKDANPAVIGTLTSATASYQLKLGEPALMAKLKTYDKKIVALQGRLRNEGKYFVVSGIVEKSAGGVVERTKRGGI